MAEKKSAKSNSGSKRREDKNEEVAFKKLRSSEPDLKVVLKYSTKEGEVQEKEYQLYSQSLAKMSKFVDTCLSVEMKEKNEKSIIFEGISPDLFESALKYLEKPVEVISMGPKTALKLVEFYHKYDFSEGTALCDQILAKHLLEVIRGRCQDKDFDIDICVDAAVVADMLDLPESKGHAVSYFGAIFWNTEHQMLHNLAHIKKLHPLFKKGHFQEDVKDLTEEEVESPLFPKFFLERLCHRFAERVVEQVWLSGTNTVADGIFTSGDDDQLFGPRRTLVLDGEEHRIFIAGLDFTGSDPIDWVIYAVDDVEMDCKVLWRCPGSKDLKIPPQEKWIPVHDFAKGKYPRVSYSRPWQHKGK